MISNEANKLLYARLKAYAIRTKKIKIQSIPNSLLKYPITITHDNLQVPLNNVGNTFRKLIAQHCNEKISKEDFKEQNARELVQLLDQTIREYNVQINTKTKTKIQQKKLLASRTISSCKLKSILLVDNRELSNYDSLRKLFDQIAFREVQLPLGDFIFANINQTISVNTYQIGPKKLNQTQDQNCIKEELNIIPTVVERKTLLDLQQSIVDKRFYSQFKRSNQLMLMDFCSEKLRRTIVLIEQTGERNAVRLDMFRTGLAKILNYPSHFLIFTKSLKDSSVVLKALQKKVMSLQEEIDQPCGDFSLMEFQKKYSKSSNINNLKLFRSQLSVISGLTSQHIFEITNLYSNFSSLIEDLKNYYENQLISIALADLTNRTKDVITTLHENLF